MRVRFENVFSDETKLGRKIQTSEYLSVGKYPVIDQGQAQIAGYTDLEDGLFTDVPAIVFGDHTRIIKYIDSPFFLGADGVKVLKAKVDGTDYKYLFYCLQNAKIPNTGYNRHFKWLKEVKIPLPPLDEQRRIAAVLDKVSDLIAKRREQLDKLDELVKARFVEMFGDPVSNTKGLQTLPLGKVCNLKAGVTTSSDEIHSQSEEYSVPCYGGNGIRGFVKKATQNGTYPIIGRQGALCGNVQLATGEFHATEHAVLVSPLIEVNVFWIYYLLKFMDLYRYHTGAAQPGLAVKVLNSVQVPIADINQQNEFAMVSECINKSKLTIQQSLDKIETLKQALMQEYFG